MLFPVFTERILFFSIDVSPLFFYYLLQHDPAWLLGRHI